MRSAKTLSLGSLFLIGGILLGTFAAQRAATPPRATSAFIVSSEVAPTQTAPTPPKKISPSLKGRLLDEEGRPVAGATLFVATQQTTSDAEGRFAFSRLTEGLVSLRVQHPGYLNHQSDSMQAVPGGSLEASITLRRPRIVSIHITSPQRRPLSAVEITVPEHEPRATDAQGSARLELSQEKATTARVLARGFQPLLLSLGEEEAVELTLPRPGSLQGELIEAPKGVQLLLLPMHEGNLTTASSLTNADPRFSFQGLLPGAYQLWARYQGETWRLRDLQVKEGETRLTLPFVAAPLLAGDSCDAGFSPAVLVERQEGALVVQKTEGELMAGDLIISIDGVPLNGDSSFLASWTGARASLARLVVERPASKRFLFLTLPRTAETPCPNDEKTP